MQPAHRRQRRVERGLHLGGVTHVAVEGVGGAAGLPDGLHNGCSGRIIDVEDGNLGAFTHKALSNRATNPVGSAGNDGFFIRKNHGE